MDPALIRYFVNIDNPRRLVLAIPAAPASELTGIVAAILPSTSPPITILNLPDYRFLAKHVQAGRIRVDLEVSFHCILLCLRLIYRF